MRTVGVEEEFLLIDAQSGRLRPDGQDITAAASLTSSGGQFEQELKNEQVELGTPPQTDLSALRASLRAGRAELAAAASARGVELAALATSPGRAHVTPTGERRYDRMHDEFGQVAAMQLTCGMHVHVSITDEDEGVAVVDAIGRWLPTLVALSANSPFWGGRDTGYASYRSVLWGQWPAAGPAAPFRSAARYREGCRQLVESGAALDDGMLYFVARLSRRYPTVEIRVADVCPYVEDAVVLAALIRALASTAAERGPDDPSFAPEVLRAAHWRAARHGVGGLLVDLSGDVVRLAPAWDVVNALVQHVSPALAATGDDQLARAGLEQIRRRGTGADAQRAAFARRDGLDDAVDLIARLTVT